MEPWGLSLDEILINARVIAASLPINTPSLNNAVVCRIAE
jgi:hypothetical protein